jgi:hypothetical protein
MGHFDYLKWTTTPTEPGWHFAWMGMDGMKIHKLLPQLIKGQLEVLGGKNDGAPLIPVKDFGARLWAGPLPIDPHSIPASELNPPELPESEYYILEELKRKEAQNGST